MNILILTTHLDAGGITSYLYNLVKGLIGLGHAVYLVSGGGNRQADFERIGARLIFYPIRTKCEISWRLVWPFIILSRLSRRQKIDVIHAQTRVTQVLGALLARRVGCPLVTTCHGFFQRRLSRRLWPCWGRAVIAISPQVKTHLETDFDVPAGRVHHVPSGIDSDEFTPCPDGEKERLRQSKAIPGGPVIGIIARLSPEKGHKVLIRAMRLVVTRRPSARLLIVGRGRTGEDLRQLTAEMSLENNVFFFDATNQTRPFLCLLDIFVLPSSQEGLGLSVMEAQAAGLPVIASRVGGLPNLIRDGQTGLLVEPNDEEGLARAIVGLLEHPDQARALGDRGREFIFTEGSYRVMAEKSVAVYRRAME